MISTWMQTMLSQDHTEKLNSGAFWALQDVSFDLKAGDSLALVGANGAGKTTILKLLAKITKPTSGDISIHGKLSALIELGAGFHPDLSGRENIFLNGTILGLKKNDILKRYDSIVSFAGLEKFIDTPVKRYSSGMAVRLGFAVAASIDPDILLVDEVLAVGDAAFRLKCMQRIQELIANGTTLVFVSHNMGLVKAVCKKSIFIEKGVIKKFGDTNEVVESYNHALNRERVEQYETQRQDKSDHLGVCSITEVLVKDQTGQTAHLETHHAAFISTHYRAYRDIGDVSVMLRVIRSDGLLCITLTSKNDEIPMRIHQGTGEILVKFSPIQLYPGTYHIAATIKNEYESLAYDMAYSDWFQVHGERKGNVDLDGVFEPSHTWEVKPQESDVDASQFLVNGKFGERS